MTSRQGSRMRHAVCARRCGAGRRRGRAHRRVARAAAAKHPKGGTLHTLAGNGKRGFSGDGGPAREARIEISWAITVDPAGNVYFTVPLSNRVRKIDTHGTITTFAGTGKPGFSGDRGPARKAKLYAPTGLAVDGKDNVYISVAGGRRHTDRVRKVNRNGIITTVAGTGKLSPAAHDGQRARRITGWSASGLAVDHDGDLLATAQRRIWSIIKLAAPVP